MVQMLVFALTVLGSSLVVTALLALFMHNLIKMGSGRVVQEASAPTAEAVSTVYDTVAQRLATLGIRSSMESEAYGVAAGNVSEYEASREQIANAAESVAEVAARQRDQIAAAIEAGKQAYREARRKAGAATGEGEER